MSPTRETLIVSVVIPCFNLGDWVEECVDSCLAQSLDSIEVLIIDDGSTDRGTLNKVAAIEESGIRVIHTENRGLGPARNLGAELSRGRYLCFLDADDRIHPEYLEKAAASLDSESEFAFASCWIRAFGSEEWTYTPTDCTLPTILAECTVATSAVVRHSAFRAVGGFDEAMPEQGDEDWDLWIRLVAAGYRGTIIPEVLFDYRRRPASMVDHCYYGEAHLVLMEYLFEKHELLYGRYLQFVLSHQIREIEELERNAERLRYMVEEHLEPEKSRLRAMEALLQAVGHTLAEAGEREQEALVTATEELEAMRTSLSWRLTAPLRRLWEFFGFVRGL